MHALWIENVLNKCMLDILIRCFLVMIFFVFYYRFMTKMLSEVTISWARQSLTFLKTLNWKCKRCLLFVAPKFALCYNLFYYLQAWRVHFEASWGERWWPESQNGEEEKENAWNDQHHSSHGTYVQGRVQWGNLLRIKLTLVCLLVFMVPSTF